MGDWYFVVKTIKGRRYRYRQRTWREGDRVRTQSQYLGPVDGGGSRQLGTDEAVRLWDQGELCELTAKDLGAREVEAVRLYTGEAYRQTNGLLRGDTSLSESEAENSAALLSALMHPKARLKHDLVLYRRALVPIGAKPGDRYHDLGFMSCTVDFSRAKAHPVEFREGYKKIILRIRAKSGINGYISPINMTMYDNEREIIRYGGWFKIMDTVEIDGELIYDIQDEGGYEIK